MRTTPVPTLILVHGLWGGAGHWKDTIPRLQKLGYGYDNLVAVDLPLTSLTDVTRLRTAIDRATGPVRLAGHSYGGAVITEAGTHDKVKGLVYLAAFAPDDGENVLGLLTAWPPPAAANLLPPDAAGYVYIDPAKFAWSFAGDVDKNDAFAMAVSQKAPLVAGVTRPIVNPAWKTKPTWYQISTLDRLVTPALQMHFAQRMNATIIEIESSHASIASHPKEVAEFIVRAAKEVMD